MRTRSTLLAAGLAAAFGAVSAQVTDTPRSEAPKSTAAQQLNVPPSQRPAAAGQQGQQDQAQRQGRVSEADREFVENAAQSGLAEVLGAQVALEKATSASVRQFADRMIKDHTAANAQLVKLARAHGVEIPTEPSPLQRGKLELLERTSRAEFDQRFIDHLGVDAHTNAVELFQRQAREGSHPQLVAFARDTLPKLQAHLRMARDLQASLQARGAGQQGQEKQRSAQGAGPAAPGASGKAGEAVQTQSGKVSATGVAPAPAGHGNDGQPEGQRR